MVGAKLERAVGYVEELGGNVAFPETLESVRLWTLKDTVIVEILCCYIL